MKTISVDVRNEVTERVHTACIHQSTCCDVTDDSVSLTT